MAKTNDDLVAYAKAQLGKPYWYGTFGNTASAQLLSAKRKQYPERYDSSKFRTGWSGQYGLRVHDCVGLIKGYLWSDTATSTPKYNAKQDVSADGMLEVCKEKGKIGTLPELPGVLVFLPGHVGVYIGNGEVIEARGHDYGVVKTKLNGRDWKNWGKCPWIEYGKVQKTTETPKPATTPKAGKTYFKRYTGSSVSIVDALASIGVQNDYSYRKKIAIANGIDKYLGLPWQNKKMVDMLKKGELIKP